MPNEEFVFEGSMGQLSGRLSLPDRPVTHSALFAHCFTCSKDIPAAKRITSALAARGIAVLSFDFTGLGHSNGDSKTRTLAPMLRTSWQPQRL